MGGAATLNVELTKAELETGWLAQSWYGFEPHTRRSLTHLLYVRYIVRL